MNDGDYRDAGEHYDKSHAWLSVHRKHLPSDMSDWERQNESGHAIAFWHKQIDFDEREWIRVQCLAKSYQVSEGGVLLIEDGYYEFDEPFKAIVFSPMEWRELEDYGIAELWRKPNHD